MPVLNDNRVVQSEFLPHHFDCFRRSVWPGHGPRWIGGVVDSVDPAVVSLDDQTVIRTTREVLAAGLAEGLIVRDG